MVPLNINMHFKNVQTLQRRYQIKYCNTPIILNNNNYLFGGEKLSAYIFDNFNGLKQNSTLTWLRHEVYI